MKGVRRTVLLDNLHHHHSHPWGIFNQVAHQLHLMILLLKLGTILYQFLLPHLYLVASLLFRMLRQICNHKMMLLHFHPKVMKCVRLSVEIKCFYLGVTLTLFNSLCGYQSTCYLLYPFAGLLLLNVIPFCVHVLAKS